MKIKAIDYYEREVNILLNGKVRIHKRNNMLYIGYKHFDKHYKGEEYKLVYDPEEEMKKRARAFVLIETDPGKEKEVMEKLLQFDEVKEVHIYSGEMDLIAVLETEREIIVPSSQRVADFVMDKIQKIAEIQDTETLIPIYSKTKWTDRT